MDRTGPGQGKKHGAATPSPWDMNDKVEKSGGAKNKQRQSFASARQGTERNVSRTVPLPVEKAFPSTRRYPSHTRPESCRMEEAEEERGGGEEKEKGYDGDRVRLLVGRWVGRGLKMILHTWYYLVFLYFHQY